MNLPANFRVLRNISQNIVADDTSPAFKIAAAIPVLKTYTDANSATITTKTDWDDAAVITATSTITFYRDHDNSNAVDYDIGTAGVVTLTNNETVADLMAVVNATKFWRLVPVACLPTDKVYANTNVTSFVAITHDTANSDAADSGEGTVFYWDTDSTSTSTGVLCVTGCIGAEAMSFAEGGHILCRRSFANYRRNSDDPILDRQYPARTYYSTRDYVPFLTRGAAMSTFNGASGNFIVYAVDKNDSVRTIFSGTVPTSATLAEFDETDGFPIFGEPGERLVIRHNANVVGTSTCTSPQLWISGGLGEWK